MTVDRMMVALSVLQGKLPEDMLTLEEVTEIQDMLFNIVAEKHLPHFDTNLH